MPARVDLIHQNATETRPGFCTQTFLLHYMWQTATCVTALQLSSYRQEYEPHLKKKRAQALNFFGTCKMKKKSTVFLISRLTVGIDKKITYLKFLLKFIFPQLILNEYRVLKKKNTDPFFSEILRITCLR